MYLNNLVLNSRIVILFLFLVLTVICPFQAQAQEIEVGLEECIRIALDHNNEIILAKEDQNIAKAKTVNAWSSVFPKINLSTGFNRTVSRQGVLSFQKKLDAGSIPASASGLMDNFGFGEEMDIYSLKLTFQQLLFGMHALPTMEAAKYGLELANYNFLGKKLMVIYQTKELYCNILKSEELLKSAVENYNLVNKLINKTEEMVAAGLATQIDLLRLKLQLKNIEQGVLGSKNNVKTTRARLNLLIGKSVYTKLKLAPLQKNMNLPKEYIDFNFLYKLALKNRPELKLLEKQAKLYEVQKVIISSPKYPSIFFNSSVGMMNYEPKFDYDKNSDWMVAVTGQWNFYDGGDIDSKVAETEATIRKINEQKDMHTRSIELELSLVINQIDLAVAKIETAQAEVSLAKQNHQLVYEKFLANTATNLEVIDSQASLSSAMINLINAQYDFQIIKAKLEYILGIANETGENFFMDLLRNGDSAE
ncbi:TolC family protein [Candidatus Margulisiibacteriota bacterium]